MSNPNEYPVVKRRRSLRALLQVLKAIRGLKALQRPPLEVILWSALGPRRYMTFARTTLNDQLEIEYRGVVIDTTTGKPIHETSSRTTNNPWASPPDGYEDCSYADDNDSACRRDVVFEARTWLLAEYPHANDPRAYWDD